MSSVIVAIDIVGSTEAKIQSSKVAIQRIRAALDSVHEALRKADPDLILLAPYAGDAMVLVGGTRVVEIFKAAVVYQGKFLAWYEGRLPLKITIGYGEYIIAKNKQGENESYHSLDIDLACILNAWCPPGGVLVTESMFAMLDEAGFSYRFEPCVERLKAFGKTKFYESNGHYKIPRSRRQLAKDRALRRLRQRASVILTIIGTGLVLIGGTIVWLYGGQ